MGYFIQSKECLTLKMDRHLMPGTVDGDWGQSNVQSGGDDTTRKCAGTDADIFVDYFKHIIGFRTQRLS
jgi:hypothetical protein